MSEFAPGTPRAVIARAEGVGTLAISPEPDLVARLRAWRDYEFVAGEVPHDLITWAIDEIEQGRIAEGSGVEREIEHLRQQRDQLLEALRNALPVLEFEVETRGSNDLLYEIPAGPVLDAARAAIARAEGRSDGACDPADSDDDDGPYPDRRCTGF